MGVKTDGLTDVQWRLVRPVFDPKVRRGRRARHSRRRMVEAVLWLARTGCRWRELPARSGCWVAVWAQWRRWRDRGVWATAMLRLHRVARTNAGRQVESSLLMVDARTVKGRRAGAGFHESGGTGAPDAGHETHRGDRRPRVAAGGHGDVRGGCMSARSAGRCLTWCCRSIRGSAR